MGRAGVAAGLKGNRITVVDLSPERGGPKIDWLVAVLRPCRPQWRMLALRLLRASVRGAMPIDCFFAGADVVLWGVLHQGSGARGQLLWFKSLLRPNIDVTLSCLDAWALV